MRPGEQLLPPALTGLSEGSTRKNGLSSQRPPPHTHTHTLTLTPSKPQRLGYIFIALDVSHCFEFNS